MVMIKSVLISFVVVLHSKTENIHIVTMLYAEAVDIIYILEALFDITWKEQVVYI